MPLAAYDKVIGRYRPPDDAPPNEVDATRANLKANWLQSTVTKEFLASLKQQADELDEQARNAAWTYSTDKNADRIVQLLVRSQQIHKIIESCQLQ